MRGLRVRHHSVLLHGMANFIHQSLGCAHRTELVLGCLQNLNRNFDGAQTRLNKRCDLVLGAEILYILLEAARNGNLAEHLFGLDGLAFVLVHHFVSVASQLAVVSLEVRWSRLAYLLQICVLVDRGEHAHVFGAVDGEHVLVGLHISEIDVQTWRKEDSLL